MIPNIILMVVFLILFVGVNVYIPLRLAKLFGLKKKIYLLIFFLAGGFSYPVFMIMHSRSSNSLIEIFYVISTVWIGYFLYLLLLFIIYELLRIFFKPPLRISGVLILAVAGLISLYGFWNAGVARINEVNIPLKNLKEELKIIQLTDVHIGPFKGKRFLEKIVKVCNQYAPDMVFITGDLVDGKGSLQRDLLSPLNKLIAPTFFVAGNHENYADLKEVYKYLDQYNIRILKNKIVHIKGIQLIGLEYMKADPESFDMHSSENDLTIKGILNSLDISKEVPSVLLHHSPVGVKYVNQKGIDLMLSGHTHGGQLFPASLFTKLFFPYTKGLYNYNGTLLYVSSGVGTFGPPMRVGTRSEITLIKLKKD